MQLAGAGIHHVHTGARKLTRKTRRGRTAAEPFGRGSELGPKLFPVDFDVFPHECICKINPRPLATVAAGYTYFLFSSFCPYRRKSRPLKLCEARVAIRAHVFRPLVFEF